MHMQKQKGLTLLELVVAVAILALFSVMAYGALDQILTQRDHLEREQTFWRTFSLVMLRFQDDLSQARPRPVRDIDGNLLPPLHGQPTDTRALADPTVDLPPPEPTDLVPEHVPLDVRYEDAHLLGRAAPHRVHPRRCIGAERRGTYGVTTRGLLFAG